MGSKRYYFYVDNKVLQNICDELQETRQLSPTINRLMMNGLGEDVHELRQQAEKRARDMKKTASLYQQLLKEKQNGKNKLFENFKKRHNTCDDHKLNIIWIEEHANKIGEDPEALLEEFENRLKDESKKDVSTA